MILLHQGGMVRIVAHSVSMAVVKHELQGIHLRQALATPAEERLLGAHPRPRVRPDPPARYRGEGEAR